MGDNLIRLETWRQSNGNSQARRSIAVAAGIGLVALAILTVGGIFVITYKLISRLPRDDNGENDDGNLT